MSNLLRWSGLVFGLLGIFAPSHAQIDTITQQIPFDAEKPLLGRWLGNIGLPDQPDMMELLVEEDAARNTRFLVTIGRWLLWQEAGVMPELTNDPGVKLRLPPREVRPGSDGPSYIPTVELRMTENGQYLTGRLAPLNDVDFMEPMDIVLKRTPRARDLDQAVSFSGVIKAATGDMDLTLVLARLSGGELIGHFDVPDNGGYELPAVGLIWEDQFIRAVMPETRSGVVTLERQPGETAWKGSYHRRDTRDVVMERDRFVAHEVRFFNSLNNRLAGTLLLPEGEGPFPAALLLSTFGIHDRDGWVGGHAVLESLAIFLAEQGIASLRFDERGVGRSAGAFGGTTFDQARDALAALATLASLPIIDRENVGIIGHGEGASIAMLNANPVWKQPVSFVALLAPSGISGADLYLAQRQAEWEAEGIDGKEIAARMEFERELIRLIARQNQKIATLEPMLRAEAKRRFAEVSDPAEANQAIDDLVANYTAEFSTAWMETHLGFNPGGSQSPLSQFRGSVLALYAGKDVIVPPPAVQRQVQEAVVGTPIRFEQRLYPGLNHLFQEAPTGLPSEYEQLEMPLAPEVRQDLADWLNRMIEQ